ncbi:hypothetical protein MaudMau93_000024 [Microsporum audouinii]
MSQEAYQAERDLNSYQAKTGRGKDISDTTQDTGVDAGVENKFPGSQVRVGPGSTASGSDEEGGEYDDLGHVSKAKDFLGSNED